MNKISKIILFLQLFCFHVGYSQEGTDLNISEIMPAEVDPENIFMDEHYYNWCPSVIQGEDGKYHMFYSRWKHGKRNVSIDSMEHIFDGFQGWLKYSEIAYAVSDHLNGPYKYVSTVIKGDGDEKRWDQFTMHNPQIKKFGEYYYLYYISNSYDPNFKIDQEISNDWGEWLKYNCTQKIGVLKAKSLSELIQGNFEPTEPLMQPDNKLTYEVANNPSVTQGPDKKYYMIFKSRKPNVGNMTMWLAKSDHPDKGFQIISDVFTEADLACEDPFLWYDSSRATFYAVVKYFSHSKVLVPQFGALALIKSKDAMHWEPAEQPLISLREIRLKGKEKIMLEHLERPFIVFDTSGNPISLVSAATIGKPGKHAENEVNNINNSFIISFDLDTRE